MAKKTRKRHCWRVKGHRVHGYHVKGHLACRPRRRRRR